MGLEPGDCAVNYRWFTPPCKIAGATRIFDSSASNSLNPVTSELESFFSVASSKESELAEEFPMHATFL